MKVRGRRWWGEAFVPTDIRNPDEPGEPLYIWKKIRPRWYWRLMRLRLFLGIVWRESYDGRRLPASVAWEVACGIYEDEIRRIKP